MKKVFFGLAVAAIALSASAFTNVKVSEGDLYIHSDSNQFTKLSSGVYNPTDCDAAGGSYKCAYRVTAAGALIVTGPFDEATANSYLSASPALIVAETGSSNGIYTP